jgi:hypothetical protein
MFCGASTATCASVAHIWCATELPHLGIPAFVHLEPYYVENSSVANQTQHAPQNIKILWPMLGLVRHRIP